MFIRGSVVLMDEWIEVGWTDIVLYGLIHSNICKLTFFTYIWSYNSHQFYPMNCKTYARLDMFPYSLTDKHIEFFIKTAEFKVKQIHTYFWSLCLILPVQYFLVLNFLFSFGYISFSKQSKSFELDLCTLQGVIYNEVL